MAKKDIKNKFNNAALLVIDVQKEFCDPGLFPSYLQIFYHRGNNWTKRVAGNIQKFVTKFRSTKIPVYAVYFTTNYDLSTPPEKAGFYKYKPKDGDIPVAKKTDSAFNSGTLAEHLKKSKIKTLYICGVNYSACVKKTALSALENKYKVHIIDDLCANDNECSQLEEAKKELLTKGAKIISSKKAFNILGIKEEKPITTHAIPIPYPYRIF